MATMTTTGRTPPTKPGNFVDRDQVLQIGAVGWDGYSRYLRARGERSRPKMIYLDGDLTLVSPGLPHEDLNVRVRNLFYEIFTTLRIQVRQVGQTTWRRRKKDTGVEGDQTYYIANEPRVRGNSKIDLRVDPPPDLAIEVVHTHKAGKALETYRRLGVPEVWVCDKSRVRILHLGTNGAYNEATHSLALPFLAAVEIFEQIQQLPGMSDLDYIEGLRRWVREVLLPRVGPR